MTETLTQRAERLGRERTEALRRYRAVTARAKEAVKALHGEGFQDVEIAALVGVDRMTVLSWTGRRTRNRSG